MSRNRMRMAGSTLGVLVLALVLTLTTGCPESEFLNTGNHEVRFETASTNNADWACVLMTITELWIAPADGTCSKSGDACGSNDDCDDGICDVTCSKSGDACGSDVDCDGGTCDGALAKDATPVAGQFQVVADGELQLANFKDQGKTCEQIPEVASGADFSLQILSSGKYRISRLRITRPELVEENGTLIDCSNYATNINEIPSYRDSLMFEVGEGAPNTVRLVIDAEALEEQFVGDCVTNLTSEISRVFSIE